LSACRKTAISDIEGILTTDREKCDACGDCTLACPTKARQIVGEAITIDEVFNRISRDKVFYDNSGGGVTLSGGEVMVYAGFAAELLSRLKAMRINTAIETCGYADWEDYKAVIEHTDHVLFDIKHADPRRHKEYTGVDNKMILDNLRKIIEYGSRVIPRYPLVPGVNDDEQSIRDVCRICLDNKLEMLHILPFHQAGETKWEGLDREYYFIGTEGMGVEAANRAGDICKSMGLRVSIGGS